VGRSPERFSRSRRREDLARHPRIRMRSALPCDYRGALLQVCSEIPERMPSRFLAQLRREGSAGGPFARSNRALQGWLRVSLRPRRTLLPNMRRICTLVCCCTCASPSDCSSGDGTPQLPNRATNCNWLARERGAEVARDFKSRWTECQCRRSACHGTCAFRLRKSTTKRPGTSLRATSACRDETSRQRQIPHHYPATVSARRRARIRERRDHHRQRAYYRRCYSCAYGTTPPSTLR
jgi:hypothetical protein